MATQPTAPFSTPPKIPLGIPGMDANASMTPQQFADQNKGKSADRTPDAVATDQTKPRTDVPEDVKKALLWVIDRYTDRFSIPRRAKVRQVLRAREYTKGRQYISFDPYTFTWFDPMEAMYEGVAGQEDLSVYRYVNNIYQMLEMSFVGALCPDVPKVRWLPSDAKNELDVQTAKHASDVQAFIERQNKIKRMQRQELMYLWTDGVYFKYTRFVVDEDKAGTRKEPNISFQQRPVVDAGYSCRGCGAEIPEHDTEVLGMVCPNCGYKLSEADYHPEETDTVPVVDGYREVAEGMVMQSIFGALHVTAAPWADDLSRSPMTRLDEEVDVGAIRTSYPDAWTEASSMTQGSADDAARIARQYVYQSIGGRNNLTAEAMPTLSRTWLQPWAFALYEDRVVVAKMLKMFPRGVKVVHLGQTLLEANAERVTDHWTWCPSLVGYGLYPPGVGDCALDVQDQYNDCRNIIMEFLDRSGTPGGFVNETAIDSRQMNDKPNLAGVFTSVKVKGNFQATPLSDLFYWPQPAINENIFRVTQDLFLFAQVVSGVMPQTFGGGQEHIDTASGQRQSLNTAMARLQQYLDEQREEHANAAQLALKIAADNYNDHIMDVVAGGPGNFTNKYIPIDELKGTARAYPESDQGFPATYAEIRDRLEKLFTAAQTNQFLLELFDEPDNMRQAANFLGVPGLVIPGEATRSKIKQVLTQLVEQEPTSRTVGMPVGLGKSMPVTIDIPSMHPDPDFDDLTVADAVVKEWAEENWQLLDSPGGKNVRAYYREIKEMQMQQAQEQVMRQGAVQMAGGGAPPPLGGPPPGRPQ